MAIVREDEEARNKERPVGGGTSYLGGGGGGGGGASSSPSYSRSGGGSSGGSAGGGFTNLSNYLYGGAQQGAELGANLAGQVEAAGTEATKNIDTFAGNAATQIKESTPTATKEAIDTYASSINPTPPPAAVAYSGPSEASAFGGYGDAQKSVQNVQEKVGPKGLGSWEGTQSMLRGDKGPAYTQGMSLYDTMFAKKSGKASIEGAQQKWSGIGDYLSGKEKGVTEGIGFAQNQATNVNQAWQDAYSTAQDRTKRIQEVAAAQPGAGAGNYTSPAKIPVQAPKTDPQVEERRKWLGPLQEGGLREGWLWSKADIDTYLKTGQKPQRKRVTSTEVGSPDGSF